MAAIPKVFCVALALTVIPLSQASNHIRSTNHFRHRRQTVPQILPGNWTSSGCYTDNPAARTLSAASFVNSTSMTIEACIGFCSSKSYIYSGVEYSQECYCDNLIHGGTAANLSDCNMPCTGNTLEACGAGFRLNLFWSGQTPPPPPVVVPQVGSWTSLGCYSDNNVDRTLVVGMGVTGALTVEKCTAACSNAGYPLSGVEYSAECYCGSSLANGGAPTPAGDCNMVCAGNSSEFCGGPDRLNVYNNTPIANPPPNPPPPSSGIWTSLGCYSDNVAARTLGVGMAVNGPLTVELCTKACFAANYSLSGVEYADECYCGSSIANGGAPTPAGDCNMACAGNSSESCGGPNRLNLYNSTAIAGLPPPPSPGSWTSLGCYSDNVAARTLGVGMAVNGPLTVELCTQACFDANYSLSGVEYADECYCGSSLANGGAPTPAGDCNMACAGNSSESCGGPNRLNLYNHTDSSPPPSSSRAIWASLGCYSDNVAARTLGVGMPVPGPLTIENCNNACFNGGYPLSGVEYSAECYCGSSFANGGAPTPPTDCNMVCAGNSSEVCGGPNRLNVYNYTGTNLPTNPNPPPPPPGGGNVFPVTSGLPAPWNYSACYVDNAFGRVLEYTQDSSNNMTVEACVATCQSQNFTLAGLEYTSQCYCDNVLVNGAVIADQATCNMPCGGNATEACGGPNRLSVYTSTGNVTALPVPVAQTTGLPGQWQFQGCLKEPNGGRVFPYQNIYTNNNTVDGCLNQCAAFGFPAAGMEYTNECWCGDITDVATNGGGMAPETDCNMICSGDPIHLCGGPLRLQLYYWNGNMNIWHTPDNIGYYEFLVPGVVVPLIATVGINNKVTFLEKGGTGFPNSTGAYELDLSLTNDFSTAWREMHVKTDVFCSGSIILPDIAARQINVGGWSLDSTFGIRLYAPDGSPGVNGTNDWEENWQELSLQRGRWYPSVAMLPNGSILVIGGETGSNASPQPNLELLPAPGKNTVVDLDWLNRTDPNNLYPFVMVLPSGRIFVGYYNEARILDPTTFDTVTVLPNMPAAVNGFLGGRTYPMEGVAMLFPQHSPYTDPVQILICGGSNFGDALDNCVFTTPEAANPTWTLERMPSKRVMPCMVALPDGTFMIMNGAQDGVAGFGLANTPNLNALLYDPTLPVGQRISILNTTIVARLYHSEATLLPDGRVLVSGSDPQTYAPNGTEIYPEEFRIEVYVPPYLNQGFTQPQFHITNTDWAYGGQYTINVQLFQGTTSNMRVSLIAATSSTHGNTMGGRTIFPAFSCSGTTCTITAPPNAYVSPPGWHQLFILDGPTPSHSSWVRIGGDPAQLGNWPALPGFNPPGL